MTSFPTMADWLATLDHAQLTAVLERNPVAAAGARVRDLDELAKRLTHPASLSNTIQGAPMPIIEVVEAVSALGAAASPGALAGLLDDAGAGPEAHREQVDKWLEVAAAAALLWVDDGLIRLNPGFDQMIMVPLAIGRPSRMLLADLKTDILGHILRAWGRRAPTRKAERLALVTELFANFDGIRRVVAEAPGDMLDLLTNRAQRRLASARSVIAYADEGERLDDDDDIFGFGSFDTEGYQARREMWDWLANAGIGVRQGYGRFGATELPSEAYLALAPSTFRAPFHPETPMLTPVSTAPEQVDRASGAAAGQFLGSAMAILETAARDRIRLLKSGGVGSRELTRFAKDVASDVATLRMTLVLADRLDLLGWRYGSAYLGTAPAFDSWRRLPPERRMLDLVMAWFAPGVAATRERDADGTYLPALKDRTAGSGIPTASVMTQLLAHQPGHAAASADEVADAITWLQPLTGTDRESLRRHWSEGHLLGALADGALAPFASALGRSDQEQALELLAELLPDETNDVLFGSDLTIVIAGNPSADIVDVLDAVAIREGHGVANTWRATEASVRSALDNGYTAEDIAESLRTIAGTELPQALTYLLRDISRRHGQVDVRPASAVITSDDEALLTEVVASRKLATLGLCRLAPTVAVASAPPPDVLAGLRKAGYLPLARTADGDPVVKLRRLPRVGSNRSDDADGTSGAGDAAVENGVMESGSGAHSGRGEAGDDSADSDDEDLSDIDVELREFLESMGDDLFDYLGEAPPGAGGPPEVGGPGQPGGAPTPETPEDLARRLLSGRGDASN
jgi:hypothetical protein